MARTVVLGIDCALYYNPVARRAGAVTELAGGWDAALGNWASGDWVEIEPIRDVTLNMTTGTADATTRASGGFRQMVPTIKEASVDFSILWLPDQTVFTDLLTIFTTQCPGAFLVLDGAVSDFTTDPPTLTVGRCGDTGDVTGLYADFAVTSFSRNESLEEAVMADVTIEPTIGLVTPEWIDIAAP